MSRHLGIATAVTLLACILITGCARQSAVRLSAEPVKAGLGTVVLVHGLGRGAGSMRRLTEALAEDGYQVCAIDYPSTRFGPPELVRQIGASIDACRENRDGPVHFVTHSLGGILVRAWARDHGGRVTGRVVMLGPPNHGSELGNLVARSGLLRAVLGPTAAELGTEPTSFANRQGPVTFAAGVLAGTKSRHPVGSVILQGANDGTVTVASARLPGMHDFATVHRAHSFIMGAPEVIHEVRRFIASGCFSRRLENVSYDVNTICAGRES